MMASLGFDMHTLAFFNMPGYTELIVILGLGLLIFGRRLPEVGRSLGRSIVEFKRGIKGIEDEVESESSRRPAERLEDRAPVTPRIADAGKPATSSATGEGEAR